MVPSVESRSRHTHLWMGRGCREGKGLLKPLTSSWLNTNLDKHSLRKSSNEKLVSQCSKKWSSCFPSWALSLVCCLPFLFIHSHCVGGRCESCLTFLAKQKLNEDTVALPNIWRSNHCQWKDESCLCNTRYSYTQLDMMGQNGCTAGNVMVLSQIVGLS